MTIKIGDKELVKIIKDGQEFVAKPRRNIYFGKKLRVLDCSTWGNAGAYAGDLPICCSIQAQNTGYGYNDYILTGDSMANGDYDIVGEIYLDASRYIVTQNYSYFYFVKYNFPNADAMIISGGGYKPFCTNGCCAFSLLLFIRKEAKSWQ